jgi:N6-L-threonylcarbamoyladenine synthase
MLVLGIESTCDETACSIVRDGHTVLSNVISSQIDLHAEYGGVVPELACRRHVDVLIPIIEESLKKANLLLTDIDLFAVAQGPGLIGAILIGLNAAKSLALALNKPLIGVNHVEAHLYAAIMSQNTPVQFPCLGVVISGGHTAMIKMDDLGIYHPISQTIDDAIGEAFDKVAKLLGLPYPGGPIIEQLAKYGDPLKYPFKAGHVKENPLSFSFSGIKTAVYYAIKDKALSESDKSDVAASFQYIACMDIIKKSLLAAQQYNYNTLLFGGGVSNNQRLRKLFAEKAPQLTCIWPSAGLTLDNAAMIAGLGYHKYLKKGKSDTLSLDAFTRDSTFSSKN